jgi:hypothetical protein
MLALQSFTRGFVESLSEIRLLRLTPMNQSEVFARKLQGAFFALQKNHPD